MKYKDNAPTLTDEIVSNICTTLHCKADEIIAAEPLKVGLTNLSFSFNTPSGKYVYRSPGKGTDSFINRESEAFSERVAKALGLDTSFIHIDPIAGWKISRFVENFRYLDPLNKNDQENAMELLRCLHNSGIRSPWDFDYGKEAGKIVSLPDFKTSVNFTSYLNTHQQIQQLCSKLEAEPHRKVLCHNDFWHWNLLKKPQGEIVLIDWEYSGNSYPEADVAYFTASLPFSDEDYIALAELYEGRKLTDQEKKNYFAVMAIVMWYWFVWALYEELLGTTVEDKELWYSKAVHAIEKSFSA